MKTLHIKRHAQPEMKKSSKLHKNGVVYARNNENGQKSPVNGLPIQVELCRRAMKQDGVNEAYPPISDVASGRDFERLGLKELLNLAKEGRIAYVYTTGLDRLGRDVVKTLNFIVQLKELGVVIRTIS